MAPSLPTHTERPSKQLDETTQSRGHRRDLHHIKGNIFKKQNKKRSCRRAAPSSAEPFTQGSLSKQFVMYRTIQMNRQRRPLPQTTAHNKNGISESTLMFSNDTFLKCHNSFVHSLLSRTPLSYNQKIFRPFTNTFYYMIGKNKLYKVAKMQGMCIGLFSPPRHQLHLFECVRPDEWNVFCRG